MKKLKLKIRHKIQFFILSTTIIIYAIALGYISIKSKTIAHEDAITISDNHVKGAASQIQVYLENYLTTIKDLSNTFEAYHTIKEENRRDVIAEIMKNTLQANDDFLAVWSTWEPYSIDSLDEQYKNTPGSTVLGNFGYMYYKNAGQIVLDESIETNPSAVFSGEYYQIPKKTRHEVILEPYYYSYTKNTADEVLETSIVSPIVSDNRFLGVVGADVQLEHFQKIVKKIKPFENSIAFLLSHKGVYVANPDPGFLGKSVHEIFPEESEKYDVLTKISQGEFLSYEVEGPDGNMYYTAYAPVTIGNTGTPWSVGIAVPLDFVLKKANQNFKVSILVGIIGLLILSLVIYFISNNITNPILQITEFLKKLSRGYMGKDMVISIHSGDEIEEMGNALNRSIKGFTEKTTFARKIGEGDFDSDIELLSEEDVLGKSLIDMRDKLREAREDEEIRKAEDQKRQWANEGLALFGEVLRKSHQNLKELGFDIIIQLVNYLKANQGGLFLRNEQDDDENYFELLATYAFNRKKYKQKKIELGEGLVGTCAIEKQTIYMTEVPDDYINITSGLGGANPKSLLIVPLKLEEEVLGVIEIASFRTFEKHEIDFVEKIAQNIASTLATVRVNEHTSRLLEKSQQQSEELAAQEEEMRQNMEELKATQEEAARKSAEMESLINALNSTSYVAEYDLHGKIISVNDAYLTLFGISRQEAIGTHHSDNVVFTEEQKEQYNQFWKELKLGNVKKEKTQVTINGKSYLFMESYTPIYTEDGEVYKILKIANDISEYLEK
ncbi:MAG: cache domain-containing protein [Bacteroidales bacterium]|jgi:methyl-accepting chemotaxis protein|nr:cache domain-containing protein [Bacteroidales bacterium]